MSIPLDLRRLESAWGAAIWVKVSASALMRDIGCLDVELRNAYDRCLLGAASPDWAADPSFTLFNTANAPDPAHRVSGRRRAASVAGTTQAP